MTINWFEENLGFGGVETLFVIVFWEDLGGARCFGPSCQKKNTPKKPKTPNNFIDN